MKSYYISKRNYYLADDLMSNYPSFFRGCKNSRSITTRKDKLPKDKYIYARNVSNKWLESDGNSKKFDKLFISKKWFDENHADSKEDVIEIAPKIIHLEDHEMFTDNNGNLIDIEVRGEREFDKCYFKVKDIMDGFRLKNLHKTIIDKRYDGFLENTHYKYFYLEKVGGPENGKIKKLYLTYRGLMRVLFSSNKNTAEKFVKWASETLFTAQMGTIDQKNQLVSNLLGVSTNAVKEVFNKTSHKIPCIYLFSIGKVKDLRKSLDINNEYDDNDYVYKWGMSNDLERRTKEHEKTYGKFKNTNLELILFGFIDPQYISQAENDIKHLFEDMNMKLDHDKYDELAVITSKQMRSVKKQYESISKIYRGHSEELIQQLKDKDTELKQKDMEIKILKKEHINELQKKENELQKKENELLKKDLEIAHMKLNKSKTK
ncbi:hypothetical protein QJ857_gp0329 [Tupanvirus soda lake]|uniref:Bro-N domain-containing protein n=2 Tax=Tupanvirus TaxID=2094720 RepID=A0A6N1NP73_9VIRU|nr:hypothetical protein QJ857_gp0329 [Tupanvirus soda lake]QKU35700.1 hypothetical protein [Tupanvirus soda lake]